MCVPLIPLAIGAAALSAVGSVAGGISAKNSANFQAGIADQNAALEQRSANDAVARGAIQEQRQYRQTSQLIGQQRAALASNGIETGFGSALAVQADAAQIGSEDAQTIRDNTQRERQGYEINAANDVAKAASDRAVGSAALTKGLFDAGSTLLSSASQVGKLRASASGNG